MPVRELTYLVRRGTDDMVGEWRGEKANITDEEIYNMFVERSVKNLGMSIERAAFDEMYEVVRYREVTQH